MLLPLITSEQETAAIKKKQRSKSFINLAPLNNFSPVVPRKTFSVRALHRKWMKNENEIEIETTTDTNQAENVSVSSSAATDESGQIAQNFSSRALIEQIKSETETEEDGKHLESVSDNSHLSKHRSSISLDEGIIQSFQKSPNVERVSVDSVSVVVPIPAPRKLSLQLKRFTIRNSLQMLHILLQLFLIICCIDLLDQSSNQPEAHQLPLLQILLMMNLMMMKTQSENQRLYLLFCFHFLRVKVSHSAVGFRSFFPKVLLYFSPFQCENSQDSFTS